MTFKAIYLEKNTDGSTRASLSVLDDDQLKGEGKVMADVEYSSLNYKDALAITGRAPVVRQWPMIPGIDGAGTVTFSSNPSWKKGDRFLINGWGVGETMFGCLAQRASLNADYLTRVPPSLSSADTMAIGTAGYTAMLSILALEKTGLQPSDGEILVTGATGGVGSIAIALLSNLGYDVVASSGKPAQHDYLKQLGAREIIDRNSLSAPGKPIQKERWAAVLDSVGSHTLVNALAQTRYGGVVSACGMAQGMDFPGSMAPFILRSVKLTGIDSVMASNDIRTIAWQRLAQTIDAKKLEMITTEITFEEVIKYAADLMRGAVSGRIRVNCQK